MNAEVASRPVFLASRETQLATESLESLAIGETRTWEQLTVAMGCDSQQHRGSINTARKNLLTEKQMVFASVHGVGYKRLSDGEVVQQEGTMPNRMKRFAKRSLTRLSTVKTDDLSDGDKRAYTMAAATIGAVALCVSSKSRNALEQRVLTSGGINPEETLKLFASK